MNSWNEQKFKPSIRVKYFTFHLEICIVCLWSQTLPSDPFNLIPMRRSLIDTYLHTPLVDPLVIDHLVLGQDVPVVAQEVLGFLEHGYWQYDKAACSKGNRKPYRGDDP